LRGLMICKRRELGLFPFNSFMRSSRLFSSDGGSMHYLMFYEYTPDYLERRTQFRAAHLKHAWGAQERGELILGGAYADPADGAALLFQCESSEIPERFAAADPYLQNGLVRRHWIRAWTTVVGQDATTPVRLE
jgi:uncharacterized protein